MIASALAAVIAGLEAKRNAPPATGGNLYTEGVPLPESLGVAIELATRDDTILEILGADSVLDFASLARSEWAEYSNEVSDWERTALPAPLVTAPPAPGSGCGRRYTAITAPAITRTTRRTPSYRRTRDLLLRAERAGFDSTLLAEHVIHPSNTEDDVLETWSTIAALAEATSRIELIGAVKPLLFNPLVFAKIAANIADIADGRLAVNLVTGWFLPELEGLGLDPLDHDDRYAYSREWIGIVTELWTGKHVSIGDRGGHPALVRPVPASPPLLYVGGESEPGRALAAEHADVFFINGRPLADTVEVIEDLRVAAARRCTAAIRPVRLRDRPRHRGRGHRRAGLSAVAVGRRERPEISGGTDPKTQMYKVLSGTKRIGSNGGTLAGLVGSYEQVVERIEAFHDAGVELFMLQFQPIEAELDRFADKIIPHFR